MVVLAPVEIAAMEQELEELRAHEQLKLEREDPHDPGARIHRRRVHFRSGDPTNHHDLLTLAAVDQASSVIVLAPPATSDGGSPDTQAAEVVKTTFALEAALSEAEHGRVPNRKRRGSRPLPVVVEVPEASAGSGDHLRHLERVFDPARDHGAGTGAPLLKVVRVDTPRLQSQLAAQVVRTAGLSDVYVELLNFDGAEIYVTDPAQEHRTFGGAVASYSGGIVVGLADTAGQPVMWPDWEDDVRGLRLVVLRRQAPTTSRFNQIPARVPAGHRPGRTVPPESTSVVIAGWNGRASRLVADLQRYSGPKGTISLVVDPQDEDAAKRLSNTSALTSTHVVPTGLVDWICSGGHGSTLIPPFASASDGGRGPLHLVLLANEQVPPAVSDARVLVMQKALHPPRINGHEATIVAEIRERTTRSLSSRHDGHELIVGHGITALLIAQFARNPEKVEALMELLGGSTDQSDGHPSTDTGVEVGFVPATELVPENDCRTFRKAQTAAWNLGLVALGYRQVGTGSTTEGRPQLHMNPPPEDAISHVADVVVLRRRLEASS